MCPRAALLSPPTSRDTSTKGPKSKRSLYSIEEADMLLPRTPSYCPSEDSSSRRIQGRGRLLTDYLQRSTESKKQSILQSEAQRDDSESSDDDRNSQRGEGDGSGAVGVVSKGNPVDRCDDSDSDSLVYILANVAGTDSEEEDKDDSLHHSLPLFDIETQSRSGAS